jgi:hypothetical protein
VQVYFAHAMTDYHTEREARALASIAAKWPGCIIVNPARAGHANAVQVMRTAGHNVMDYFCGLVRQSDAVASMETEDFRIGPGVAKEMLEAAVFGIPLYRVAPQSIHGKVWGPVPFHSACFHAPLLTIAELRERMKAKHPES